MAGADHVEHPSVGAPIAAIEGIEKLLEVVQKTCPFAGPPPADAQFPARAGFLQRNG